MNGKKFILLRGGKEKRMLPQNLLLSAGRQVEDFETIGEWTQDPAGHAAADTDIFTTGTKSIKITCPGSTFPSLTKTYTPGFTISDPSAIRLDLYIEDITVGGTLYIYLYNSTGNYFMAAMHTGSVAGNPRMYQGWNRVQFPQAKWTATGSPSWTSPFIKVQISLRATTATPKVGYVDNLVVDVNPLPAVVWGFDDGYSSQFTMWQILRAKKQRGTTFMVTNNIGSGGYLTAAQLRTMSADGWDVANHTKDHTDLLTGGLTDEQITAEFADAAAALDALGLTRASLHAAMPYNSWSAQITTDALAAGILSVRDDSVVGSVADSLILPFLGIDTRLLWRRYYSGLTNTMALATMKAAVDEAVSRKMLMVIVGHKIGAVADALTWTTSDFTELVDYVASKQMQSLTLSEMYRLMSGPIKVSHK